MAFFKPNRYFARITRVDIQRDLLACGFRFVLLDIDNTILSRETHAMPHDVAAWLARAREAGITFCLVSNNWHANVHELAADLDLPIVAKAMKPFPAAFFSARRRLGAKRRETVVIGDQLMTDVVGAHLAGLCAYMLVPLVEKDLPHTLFLRKIERVLMGDARPEDENVPIPVPDDGVLASSASSEAFAPAASGSLASAVAAASPRGGSTAVATPCASAGNKE